MTDIGRGVIKEGQTYLINIIIPYSRKYWQELNLAVEPKKIAIARILADLNLVVRYRIAIRIFASRKFGRF